MSVNKVILIGNVGVEPNTKIVNGTLVAEFSLATLKTYTDKNSGNKITNTEWHNIVIWGGLAKVVEDYVKSGSKLYLEGELQTNKWEKDGNKFQRTEVICNQMVMLDKKENAGN